MKPISLLLRGLLAAGLVGIAATGAVAADASSDQRAVRQVLMAQFDKPDARLQVEPTVVVGNTALASWAQGERGGRALLTRTKGQWHIAVCAGDGLKDAKSLQDAGVTPATSTALARQLATAEAKLPPAQRAKFSTFDGVVRMDAAGKHPPSHAH